MEISNLVEGVRLTARARARVSGLQAAGGDTAGVNLMHVRDGKVTRWVNYRERARALADLRLEA